MTGLKMMEEKERSEKEGRKETRDREIERKERPIREIGETTSFR